MKAISLKQPMAWAIFNGKPVENRGWNTHYRGPLLIHASRHFDVEDCRWIQDNSEELGIKLPSGFLMGYLLGVAELVKVIAKKDSVWDPIPGHPPDVGSQHNELEYMKKECPEYFSPWFVGPFGFVLKNAKLFKLPIQYKGKLGIFDVPDEVVSNALAEIKER